MPTRRSLSPAAEKALGYWGVIELAAAAHANTADMWEWIRQAADELGLASPGVTVQGVSELRGRAGEIVRTAEQFAKLPDAKRVTQRYVAHPPWARTFVEQRALPKFAVRYQHTFIQNGNLQTEWRTSVFPGRLNHTAGRLRSDVELDATNLARKYATEHVGTANLQILVI